MNIPMHSAIYTVGLTGDLWQVRAETKDGARKKPITMWIRVIYSIIH